MSICKCKVSVKQSTYQQVFFIFFYNFSKDIIDRFDSSYYNDNEQWSRLDDLGCIVI